MTNPTIQIFDGETSLVIEREMTESEIAEHKADLVELEAKKVEEDAKVAARKSALAKLAELGLTEEEIAAL
jgi:hypothetical protein